MRHTGELNQSCHQGTEPVATAMMPSNNMARRSGMTVETFRSIHGSPTSSEASGTDSSRSTPNQDGQTTQTHRSCRRSPDDELEDQHKALVGELRRMAANLHRIGERIAYANPERPLRTDAAAPGASPGAGYEPRSRDRAALSGGEIVRLMEDARCLITLASEKFGTANELRSGAALRSSSPRGIPARAANRPSPTQQTETVTLDTDDDESDSESVVILTERKNLNVQQTGSHQRSQERLPSHNSARSAAGETSDVAQKSLETIEVADDENDARHTGTTMETHHDADKIISQHPKPNDRAADDHGRVEIPLTTIIESDATTIAEGCHKTKSTDRGYREEILGTSITERNARIKDDESITRNPTGPANYAGTRYESITASLPETTLQPLFWQRATPMNGCNGSGPASAESARIVSYATAAIPTRRYDEPTRCDRPGTTDRGETAAKPDSGPSAIKKDLGIAILSVETVSPSTWAATLERSTKRNTSGGSSRELITTCVRTSQPGSTSHHGSTSQVQPAITVERPNTVPVPKSLQAATNYDVPSCSSSEGTSKHSRDSSQGGNARSHAFDVAARPGSILIEARIGIRSEDDDYESNVRAETPVTDFNSTAIHFWSLRKRAAQALSEREIEKIRDEINACERHLASDTSIRFPPLAGVGLLLSFLADPLGDCRNDRGPLDDLRHEVVQHMAHVVAAKLHHSKIGENLWSDLVHILGNQTIAEHVIFIILGCGICNRDRFLWDHKHLRHLPAAISSVTASVMDHLRKKLLLRAVTEDDRIQVKEQMKSWKYLVSGLDQKHVMENNEEAGTWRCANQLVKKATAEYRDMLRKAHRWNRLGVASGFHSILLKLPRDGADVRNDPLFKAVFDWSSGRPMTDFQEDDQLEEVPNSDPQRQQKVEEILPARAHNNAPRPSTMADTKSTHQPAEEPKAATAIENGQDNNGRKAPNKVCGTIRVKPVKQLLPEARASSSSFPIPRLCTSHPTDASASDAVRSAHVTTYLIDCENRPQQQEQQQGHVTDHKGNKRSWAQQQGPREPDMPQNKRRRMSGGENEEPQAPRREDGEVAARPTQSTGTTGPIRTHQTTTSWLRALERPLDPGRSDPQPAKSRNCQQGAGEMRGEEGGDGMMWQSSGLFPRNRALNTRASFLGWFERKPPLQGTGPPPASQLLQVQGQQLQMPQENQRPTDNSPGSTSPQPGLSHRSDQRNQQPQSTPNASRRQCFVCRSTAEFECVCSEFVYCGQACYVEHWNDHWQNCRYVKDTHRI